jgi:hypothetical protein
MSLCFVCIEFVRLDLSEMLQIDAESTNLERKRSSTIGRDELIKPDALVPEMIPRVAENPEFGIDNENWTNPMDLEAMDDQVQEPLLINSEISIPMHSGLSEGEKNLLSWKVRKQLETRDQSVKVRYHTGTAPSKFARSLDKWGKGNQNCRKWISARSERNWRKLKNFLLQKRMVDRWRNLFEDFVETDYDIAISQGFKVHHMIRRPRPIHSVICHDKIPAHLLDGSLGTDVEGTSISRGAGLDEEESGIQQGRGDKKNSKIQSLLIVDMEKELLSVDISSRCELKCQPKIHFEYTLVSFISKYSMYAGLIDQKMIKVFCL